MVKYSYETSCTGDYELLKANARYNRSHMTDAESVLWERLRGKHLGVRFRRQHPIGDYIVDFVCISHSLVVEVDGAYHATQEMTHSDAERTDYLQSMGFRVIRFTNDEIIGDVDGALKRISAWLDYTSDKEQ